MAELISAMGNKSADDLPMTRPTPSTTVALRRSLATIGLVLLAACAGRTAETQAVIEHPAAVDIKQLWIDPVDLESRDLFNGPGGAKLAPNPAARYEIVEVDETGFSAGYAVRDDQGTAWNVKLGIEAQPEVVASRLLWALGYHQPPTYLVTTWKLAGEDSGAQGISRFRRESPNEKVVSDWSWYENPFERTQPFKGLVVANLILNNWDWKTSNNKVYAGDAGHRKYIVRDVGASLGKTTFPQFLKWTPLRMGKQGSRNDLEGFEGQGFIKGVEADRVKFDYKGVNTRLIETVTVRDVVWTCRLMSRLSPQQWDDAFRAAAYQPAERQRFIAKLKSKIGQGLALASS
jgi:hypothetical protein